MATKNNWQKAAEENQIKEGVPFGAQIGARAVFLTQSEGRIYAMDGKCSHYGGPLEKGRLMEHIVTCPWHAARFDVRSGEVKAPPALDDLARYETKVEAGEVYVRKVPAEELSIPTGTDERTFLILGSGAGGLNAALSLRKIGFAGRVLLVTAESDLPYDRPDLSKGFMAGDTKRDELSLKPEGVYRRLGIEILREYRATGVDTIKKTVTFSNRRRLRYDKLLLATGGTPRVPEIKGTRLPGFFVLRSFRDALAITSSLSRAKTVAVLGGSFLGLEVASSLRTRGLDVHVIAPETVLMARVFGPRIGEFLKRRHQKNGVVFHLGRTAAEILGAKKVSGLLVNGAVLVNAGFQTRDPDIFAVGDIALLPDPVTGEARRVEHWVEAERQGQHAALGMTGIEEPYRETPFFWTNQAGVSIKYAGYTSSFDRVVYRGDLEEEKALAGYYREGALRAVASLGRTKEFLAAMEIIKAGSGVPQSRFKDLRFDFAKAS